jgi:phosphatidylserine/phosphatidylglycerophosphate/cardiolipin synthase-like enzyme
MLLAAFASVAASSSGLACTADVSVCFRPGAVSCAARVVASIAAAERELLVQAYTFTSPEIVQAIGDARKRGVAVRVILDKENRQPRYTGATYLRNAGVPVRIDDTVAIAHNKVMVIDGALVIGGSYNYTRSAETRNAENVTFSRSTCLAETFRANFERRWQTAAPAA